MYRTINSNSTVYRTINSNQVRRKDRTEEGQVIINRDRGIIRRDHISRRNADRVVMEGGGNDRMLEIKHEYDSMKEERKGTGGEGGNKWQVEREKEATINWKRLR